MEIKLYKYYFIYLIISSFCLGDEINFYKIKFLGFNAANCKQTISDTTFNNYDCIKIHYKVETTNLLNYFFKIINKYTTIIKRSSAETLYFHKDTVQPKVKNNISTKLLNNNVQYSQNFKINKNELTVFSLLYLMSKDNIDRIKLFNILDREGKKYKFYLNEVENKQFELFTTELNKNKKGYIEHTDVFSWGVFLPNTKKYIYINSKNQVIDKCIFKRGILSISAKRIIQ